MKFNFRKDRDFIVAIVALLSSFITPFWIRYCDKKDSIPRIEFKAIHLHPIFHDKYPALVEKIVNSWNYSKYSKNILDENQIIDMFPWMTHHIMFEFIFLNQKNLPVSITNIEVAEEDFTSVNKNDKFFPIPVALISNDYDQIETHPIIYRS